MTGSERGPGLADRRRQRRARRRGRRRPRLAEGAPPSCRPPWLVGEVTTARGSSERKDGEKRRGFSGFGSGVPGFCWSELLKWRRGRWADRLGQKTSADCSGRGPVSIVKMGVRF